MMLKDEVSDKKLNLWHRHCREKINKSFQWKSLLLESIILNQGHSRGNGKTEQMWEIFWSYSQLSLQGGQFKKKVKGYSGIPVLGC